LLAAALAPHALAQEGATVRPLRFEALVPGEAGEPAAIEIPVQPGGLLAPSEALKLQFHCEISGLAAGQAVHSAWIAEDLGTAVPPGYTADAAQFITSSSHIRAVFALKRPQTGWPPGRYRLEIRLGDQILYAERFTIR
jgi:hypothetical protein